MDVGERPPPPLGRVGLEGGGVDAAEERPVGRQQEQPVDVLTVLRCNEDRGLEVQSSQ